MRRLFWKFFLVLSLAHTVAVLGVGLLIGLHNREMTASHQRAPFGPPPAGEPHAFPRHDEPRAPGEDWRHEGRPPARLVPLLPLVSGLAVSLVFAGLLARYFAKPIGSLRRALDAASRGDLAVRLGPEMGGRRDELADLGRDFDSMAQRLQSLLDGQRRLFHDVSHELRSPLARMQAAIGLARQQPERVEQALLRVERESVRIDLLVSELLTLARLESGMAKGALEEVELGELLANLIDDSSVEAEAKSCRLRLESASPVLVNADAELLRRGVENVLRNAIRHSPPGAEVSVGIRPGQDGTGVQISVRDQGGGVPEDVLARLFEPFFRAAAASSGDGHGLGLAIAQRVAQTHGGSISAHNEAGGLLVLIELPVLGHT